MSPAKKRILIITTGGTIASVKTDEGLTPKHTGNELISGVEGYETEIRDLFAVDSTDITPAHWLALCNEVKNAADYDGVVILHGTDTLEYTAAALAQTCFSLDKPVIITGSMLPFGAGNSDAERNIRDAVLAAYDGRLKGVFVVFAGHIIAGYDAVKCDSLNPDAFKSFSGKYTGYISESGVVIERNPITPQQFVIPAASDVKTAVIKLSPFTDELYVPDGYLGAVIESFGAGGIADNQRLLTSLKALCKRMTVIMTTNCLSGANLDTYAVGKRALECGVIDGKEMSTSFAAVKLFFMNSKN